MADYRLNYGATGALLIVNDLVIAGISAGDEGVRGFLDAYRASTGERVWRFWTVPARGEPGSETWIGKALEHGCATTWLTGSYDPEARLLYWPTGNPCPDYNGEERKGDNLYSSSIVALDPATGQAAMAFSIHAARPSRLGCESAAAARRRRISWTSTQAARRRQSKRVLLRARSAHRPDADGGTVREQHLPGRPASAPTAGRNCWPGYENSVEGTRDVSLRIRRRQLAILGVQPGNGLVLRDGVGSVCGVHGRIRTGSSSANRSTAERQRPRRSKAAENF